MPVSRETAFKPQFSSVQSLSGVWLCDPMDCSTPGFPVHHQLPELAQTHVHRVGDAIQSSHPLLSPSPPAFNLSQHQGLFQWVSSSHQVAKILEFQLQHQSFQWIFRTSSKWIWNLWSFSQIPCCLFPLGAAQVGSAVSLPRVNGVPLVLWLMAAIFYLMFPQARMPCLMVEGVPFPPFPHCAVFLGSHNFLPVW